MVRQVPGPLRSPEAFRDHASKAQEADSGCEEPQDGNAAFLDGAVYAIWCRDNHAQNNQRDHNGPILQDLRWGRILCRTLNGTPFTRLAWTGFNTATKQYEATRIASTNSIRIAETGAYDEKTSQFELKADYPFAGDTWRQRTVIERRSPDTMIAASYLSFGKVPEWKGVEINIRAEHSSSFATPIAHPGKRDCRVKHSDRHAADV